MRATWDESRGGRDEPEGLNQALLSDPGKGRSLRIIRFHDSAWID